MTTGLLNLKKGVGEFRLVQDPPATNAWFGTGFASTDLVQDNTYITVTVPEAFRRSKAVMLWASFTNESEGSLTLSFRPLVGVTPLALGMAAGGAASTVMVIPLSNGTFQVACDAVTSLTGEAKVIGAFG